VTKFIRLGGILPVGRKTRRPATCSGRAPSVSLAHRNVWHQCGGYDERADHYDWMETDMIGRLRQSTR
jgi:hypothetical protein